MSANTNPPTKLTYRKYKAKLEAILAEAKEEGVKIWGWDDESILIGDIGGFTVSSVNQSDLPPKENS